MLYSQNTFQVYLGYLFLPQCGYNINCNTVRSISYCLYCILGSCHILFDFDYPFMRWLDMWNISMVGRVRAIWKGTLREVLPPALLLHFHSLILSTSFTLNITSFICVWFILPVLFIAQLNRYMCVFLFPFISYMKDIIPKTFFCAFFSHLYISWKLLHVSL